MKKTTISGSHRQVSWGDTFAYALPALSLAVIGIPVYVFLPLWIAVSRKIGKKSARRARTMFSGWIFPVC